MAEAGYSSETFTQPEMETIDDVTVAAEMGEAFDDVEMAATGINMLLNDGFEEAFALFHKYK